MSHFLETNRALAEVCDNNNVSFDTDGAVIDRPRTSVGTMREQHENDMDDNRRRAILV